MSRPVAKYLSNTWAMCIQKTLISLPLLTNIAVLSHQWYNCWYGN